MNVLQVESVVDDATEVLRRIESAEGALSAVTSDEAKNLKRRNLVDIRTRKSYKITKGPNFSLQRKKQAAGLNKEMLEGYAFIVANCFWECYARPSPSHFVWFVAVQRCVEEGDVQAVQLQHAWSRCGWRSLAPTHESARRVPSCADGHGVGALLSRIAWVV